MVFSDLLFIYLFLPLNLICYSLARSIRTKNNVLILFSLIFYAWAGPKYLLLLLAMVFVNWSGGLFVYNSKGKAAARAGLFYAVALSLGLLAVFKYTGFFLGTVQAITGRPKVIPNIVLPIGISFYTFQLLSYTVDVYRKEVPAQKSFKELLLYAGLFHQCVAGPIVRYNDIRREIHFRIMSSRSLSEGISRFIVGLAKKALLANTCGKLAETFLPPDALRSAPALSLWLGVLFYMLQIYLDFSAYSDMAIGMGRMIGFHYKENFDYPYLSTSVTEFWRRWHISLGSFFRDYVYIPLGGNRRGLKRTIFNLFVVWFLTGLWHGASWNYVLWGLYFFVFIAAERLFSRRGKPGAAAAKEDHSAKRGRWKSHLYLLVVVYFGWVLFKFENLSDVGIVLKGMLGLNHNGFTSFETNISFLNNVFFLLVAIIACTPLVKRISTAIGRVPERHVVRYKLKSAVEIALPVVLLLLSTMALVGNSYNPFLYFQF